MQHLRHAQSARQMKEKNQQVFIDTLTLVRRMIDFGLYINIYRGTYAEKCMNIVHGMYKKGLFLRALPLSLSLPPLLPCFGLLCLALAVEPCRAEIYMYIYRFFFFRFIFSIYIIHSCVGFSSLLLLLMLLFVCWPELNQYTAHVRSALTSTIRFVYACVCVCVSLCICVSILYVMVFGFSPDFIQIVYNVVGSLV